MISSSVLVCLTPLFIDGFMALKVTSPCRTSTWNLQNPNTVTWTSVATDPKKFDIVLVNNNPKCAPTAMSQVIKQGVSCSDGKFDISGISPVKPCGDYQINLVAVDAADSYSSGILAQSAPFTVTPASTPATAQASVAHSDTTKQPPAAGGSSTPNTPPASHSSADVAPNPSISSATSKSSGPGSSPPVGPSPLNNATAAADSAGSFASTSIISFQKIIAAAFLPVSVLFMA